MTNPGGNGEKSSSLGSTLAKWPLRTVVAILVLGAILIEHKDLMGLPLNRSRRKNKRRP